MKPVYRGTLYSVDNVHFYKRDDFIYKYGLNITQFNYKHKRGEFYKLINGIQIKNVHIAKSSICKVTFADTDNVTNISVIDEKNNGKGDYKITYKDITDNYTTLFLTTVELYKMFGFVVWFAKYPNVETDKKMIIRKYGKGVVFI